MEDLKRAIVTAPCLQPINYHCDQWVILVVDSSHIATGFILFQLEVDGKRYPSRFGSITWNNHKSTIFSSQDQDLWPLACSSGLPASFESSKMVCIFASVLIPISHAPRLQNGVIMTLLRTSLVRSVVSFELGVTRIQ